MAAGVLAMVLPLAAVGVGPAAVARPVPLDGSAGAAGLTGSAGSAGSLRSGGHAVALSAAAGALRDEPAASDGVWPLDPRPHVVAHFDPPATRWGAGHRGVDLQGRVGQPVRAALGGTVSFAGRIAGRGVLVVDHGATRTTYEPVAALVPVGTGVARGEVVGRLEALASHCSPAACLHWGWRRGEAYLDPLALVGGGPVRLLPLAGAPAPGPAGSGGWAALPR